MRRRTLMISVTKSYPAFDVTAEKAMTDIEEFIAELVQAGFDLGIGRVYGPVVINEAMNMQTHGNDLYGRRDGKIWNVKTHPGRATGNSSATLIKRPRNCASPLPEVLN